MGLLGKSVIIGGGLYIFHKYEKSMDARRGLQPLEQQPQHHHMSGAIAQDPAPKYSEYNDNAPYRSQQLWQQNQAFDNTGSTYAQHPQLQFSPPTQDYSSVKRQWQENHRNSGHEKNSWAL